ncbi:MAG: exosortase-associated EpsI family protein [Phycisphaeraceae bacterium]|nr:exosortase-associated EpsI family protein [Phycisphaeraceae bacterium]
MAGNLAKILTAVLLLGVMIDVSGRPPAVDADPYHTQVRAAVARIPTRIGVWSGVDEPVPPAARALLRPNAIFSRAYSDPVTGQTATLVLVQCRDGRGMMGHYPPVCYPAHGWEEGEPEIPVDVQVAGQTIPMTRYSYVQGGFNRRKTKVIYGFFVIPRTGLAREMDGVRRAASDYRTRGLGAAQVQVILGDGLSRAEEAAMVRELLAPVVPVIDLIRSGEVESTR